MPDTENTGYLVQLQSPEGDNLYPIISAEMIKDAEGNTYNLPELFQSVSEGKSAIAAAVTDKGVTTAADATFQQIATNIGNIPVLDTSDANATASQILSGYSAYVNGAKINGSMVNRGAISGSVSPGGSYAIPAGYHNGSGRVTGTGQSYPFSGSFRTMSISESSEGTYLPSDAWLIPNINTGVFADAEGNFAIKINGTWYQIRSGSSSGHIISSIDSYSLRVFNSTNVFQVRITFSESSPKIDNVSGSSSSPISLYYL